MDTLVRAMVRIFEIERRPTLKMGGTSDGISGKRRGRRTFGFFFLIIYNLSVYCKVLPKLLLILKAGRAVFSSHVNCERYRCRGLRPPSSYASGLSQHGNWSSQERCITQRLGFWSFKGNQSKSCHLCDILN